MPIQPENGNASFGNDVIFSSSRALMSDRAGFSWWEAWGPA